MEAASTYWRRPTAAPPSQPNLALDGIGTAPILVQALRRVGLWRSEYLATLSDLDLATLLGLLRAVVPEITEDIEDDTLLAFGRLIEFSCMQGPIDENKNILAYLRGTSYEPAGLALGEASTARLCLVRANLPLGAAAVWPTRRKRLLANASSNQRQEVQEKERARWLPRLLDLIVVGQLPLWIRAKSDDDPRRTMKRAGMGRRGKTMRQHVRMLEKKCNEHLIEGAGDHWHASLNVILEYLESQADEPQPRSWFLRFRAAINFVEEAGEVPQVLRFGMQDSFLNSISDIVKHLIAGAPAAPKKAMLFPIALVVALELAVIAADLPLYDRLYAWFKLVRLWIIARGNDMEGTPPSGVKWRRDGLDLTCDQSKVSGPGKKVETYISTVATGAYIAVEDWLEIGYRDLWCQLPDRPRDFFLELPSKDRQSTISQMATYAHCAAMTSALFAELPRPIRVDVDEGDGFIFSSWEPAESQALLMAGLEKLYSEHCEKAVLPSWAFALGMTSDQINRLGPWSMQIGESYARTVRAYRVKTQRDIAARIRANYGKEDIIGDMAALDSVESYLRTHGTSDENTQAQLRRLRYFDPNVLPVSHPVSPVSIGLFEIVEALNKASQRLPLQKKAITRRLWEELQSQLCRSPPRRASSVLNLRCRRRLETHNLLASSPPGSGGGSLHCGPGDEFQLETHASGS